MLLDKPEFENFIAIFYFAVAVVVSDDHAVALALAVACFIYFLLHHKNCLHIYPRRDLNPHDKNQ